MQDVGVGLVQYQRPSEAVARFADYDQQIELASAAEEAADLLRQVKAIAGAAREVRAARDVVVMWKRTQLRAERRWGQLLDPPKPPANRGQGRRKQGQHVRDSARPERDLKAEQRAREVAAVPLAVFDNYLLNEDPENLTRAGLLRAAGADEETTWQLQRARVAAQNYIASPVPSLGIPGRDPRLLARAPDRQLPLCVRVGDGEELWMAECPHCGGALVG